MRQLINVEDMSGRILVVVQNRWCTSQRTVESPGVQSMLDCRKEIWDALDWLFHQLIQTMYMRLLRLDTGKRVFIAQQTKVKIGANKVISIQVVIITKKSCAIRPIKIKCSRWIRTCITRKMVEKPLNRLAKLINTWTTTPFGLIQQTQIIG